MKTIYSEPYEALIVQLIHARKSAHLTQQQLAVRLDKPQSFVSKYERGERRLDVIEFIRVTHALGVSGAQIVAELETNWPSS
jgi:transcriptional regulator with XRE-family HTH domain